MTKVLSSCGWGACTYLSLTLSYPVLAENPTSTNPPSSEFESNVSEGNDSITVVGERLRRAGGAIGVDFLTGKMTCKVTNPSGDERIDSAACDIALRCARQNRRDRDRFNACVEAGYEAFLDTYLNG